MKKTIYLTILSSFLFNLGFNYPALSLVLLWCFSGAFFLWLELKQYGKLNTTDYFLMALNCSIGPIAYFCLRDNESFKVSCKKYNIPHIKFRSPLVITKQ